MVSIQTGCLDPSSKLKGVGEQVRTLDEKSTALRYLDNAQDSEDVNGLLEDLQEAVNNYLVRS